MIFSLFTIDTDYCDYLRKYDSKVPYNKEDKESRPFLGIVIDMNGFDYYAPLTEVFNAASPLLQWWVRRFFCCILCVITHILHTFVI